MKIYIDMDGVLCDYSTHFTNLTGLSSDKKVDQDVYLEYVKDLHGTDFFYTIPKTSCCDQVIQAVSSLFGSYEILSTPFIGDDINSSKHKCRWLKDNIIHPPKKANFTRNKSKFASEGSVLIDDHRKNCEDFAKAGGISIKFKHNATHYSVADLILALIDLAKNNNIESHCLIDLKRNKKTYYQSDKE